MSCLSEELNMTNAKDLINEVYYRIKRAFVINGTCILRVFRQQDKRGSGEITKNQLKSVLVKIFDPWPFDLTDKTKIANYTWANLKGSAMGLNYKKEIWFVSNIFLSSKICNQ